MRTHIRAQLETAVRPTIAPERLFHKRDMKEAQNWRQKGLPFFWASPSPAPFLYRYQTIPGVNSLKGLFLCWGGGDGGRHHGCGAYTCLVRSTPLGCPLAAGLCGRSPRPPQDFMHSFVCRCHVANDRSLIICFSWAYHKWVEGWPGPM